MRKIASNLVMCGMITVSPVFAAPISVSSTTDASDLVDTLLGSGIALVGTPTYTGAAGLFFFRILRIRFN